MITAGHLACGPVTAMRSLSSALGNRHDQEGAASRRPVGGGRRDGHDRGHPGRRRPGHADGDQASACSSDPARAGRHRGGHCVRPGGPGGVRHRSDRGKRKAPAAAGQDGSPARSRPPGPRGGPPSAWQVTRAWQVTGAWQGRARVRHPGRRRAHRARRRSAFCAVAAAEPDERLLTGRAHRHAQGWPWIRDAGRRGHPGDPAYRGTRPGSCRAGSGSSSWRAEPGPAVPRPRRTSVTSWLPAGYEPGRSRAGAVRPGRPAGASHAAA